MKDKFIMKVKFLKPAPVAAKLLILVGVGERELFE